MAIRKLCKHPNCPNFAIKNGYCNIHQEDYKPRAIPSKWSESPYQSLYRTKQWQNLSSRLLIERPVCQKCGRAQSTEVHHIVHGEGDDFFDEQLLVCLCSSCHLEETRRETNERREAKKDEEELKKRYGI